MLLAFFTIFGIICCIEFVWIMARLLVAWISYKRRSKKERLGEDDEVRQRVEVLIKEMREVKDLMEQNRPNTN